MKRAGTYNQPMPSVDDDDCKKGGHPKPSQRHVLIPDRSEKQHHAWKSWTFPTRTNVASAPHSPGAWASDEPWASRDVSQIHDGDALDDSRLITM